MENWRIPTVNWKLIEEVEDPNKELTRCFVEHRTRGFLLLLSTIFFLPFVALLPTLVSFLLKISGNNEKILIVFFNKLSIGYSAIIQMSDEQCVGFTEENTVKGDEVKGK